MQLLRSEKAVSEVVGQVFILSLTIVGVAAITLFGVPSIYRLEDMADVRATEQAFTAMDSRVSSVIIGDSPMKSINVNLGGGILTVVPNSTGRESYIVIKSANNTFNITIPMGKLEYTLGDRIVAYEGGGVWSKYPSGGSIMLSPPEFHYDGRTLTLPVPTITGNASISGKGAAAVTFTKDSAMVLFPNTTIDLNRTNPLNYSINGRVYVNITSDFYDAWAEYARSLLYANVTTDPTSRTASMELMVVPSNFGGSNPVPNPINIRGLPTDGDTPLDKWSFRIALQGKEPWNIDWDIRGESGSKTLIFYLKGTGLQVRDKVDLEVGYKDSSISADGETWEGDDLFTVQDGGYVDVDLLNKSVNLTYESENVGADNANKCQPFGMKIKGIANPDYSWNDLDITDSNANNTQPLYNITQHYILKLTNGDTILLSQCTPSGNQGPSANSTMILGYNATGALTFLQISEYNVRVGLR
jgi:hypothetical protein